jgi:hypothetical protein
MGTLLQRATSLLIYGGTLRMRPYEAACLEGWARSLPEAAQDIFRRQIALLDRYKRSREGRILLLFPSGWPNGKPLPTDVRFALNEDESRVARVRMDCSVKADLRVDAIIVLQHGQLTSVEFSRALPRACWAHAVVRDVTTLRDVLAGEGREAPGVELPPTLSWLAVTHPGGTCMSPRTEEEIKAFISSFETRFPPGYEATLRAANGVSAGPVKIYGVGDAWTIPRPDGPFVSIANVRDVGDLAAKIGDHTGAVYLLDAEGDEVRQLHGDFMDALREAMSLGKAQETNSAR